MQAIRRDVRRVGPISGILAVATGVGLWIGVLGVQRPDWAPWWAGWVVILFSWSLILLGVWIVCVCLRLHEPPEMAPRQMTDAERAELLAFQQALDEARRVEQMVALGRAGLPQMDTRTLTTAQRGLTQMCEALANT